MSVALVKLSDHPLSLTHHNHALIREGGEARTHALKKMIVVMFTAILGELRLSWAKNRPLFLTMSALFLASIQF